MQKYPNGFSCNTQVEDPWFIYLLAQPAVHIRRAEYREREQNEDEHRQIKWTQAKYIKQMQVQKYVFWPCLGPRMYLWAEQAVGEGEMT